MGIIGQWFEKIPVVWKALGALGTAAVAGGAVMSLVIGGLSVPQQVSANSAAITRNAQAIDINTEAIRSLRSTEADHYNALMQSMIVSICEQRQLHELAPGRLSDCMVEVRHSIEQSTGVIP